MEAARSFEAAITKASTRFVMKIVTERIDPQLAEALAAIPKSAAGIFDLTDIEGTRAAIHEMADAANAAATDDGLVSIETIEARHGAGPTVSIRLLQPTSGPTPMPALLWFHGGGQVLGYAAQDDAALKRLCTEVGCIVAAVDYRLAPEARSPAASKDGFSAYQWLLEEATRLGIDEDRIGIAGASGGGCIAAATTLMIRDRGAPQPLFQALHYPMLDDRNVTASSHEITDIGIWDRATNILAWKAILGDRAPGDNVSSYSAPARAEELAGLPPTLIIVGELDVFRDEDLAFANRLIACGVPTEFHLYPGAYHAWDLFAPDARLTAAFLDTWYGYLRRQFRL
jgi:acetyl esterase/lipase